LNLINKKGLTPLGLAVEFSKEAGPAQQWFDKRDSKAAGAVDGSSSPIASVSSPTPESSVDDHEKRSIFWNAIGGALIP
jgi:hypothetical protein